MAIQKRDTYSSSRFFNIHLASIPTLYIFATSTSRATILVGDIVHLLVIYLLFFIISVFFMIFASRKVKSSLDMKLKRSTLAAAVIVL